MLSNPSDKSDADQTRWLGAAHFSYLQLRLHLHGHRATHPVLSLPPLYGPKGILSEHNTYDNAFKSFRLGISMLSEPELVKVVNAVQGCIDNCPLEPDVTSLRLRFLQDICSLSGVVPTGYWVTSVSIGRRIASGGEATIYRAKYRDSLVAVREFHRPMLDEGKSILQLIIREVIAHWQLRHPNVVTLFGIYRIPDEEEFDAFDIPTLALLPAMVLQHAKHSSAQDYLKTHSRSEDFLQVAVWSTV
ncbi:hypothetical protein DL93DRAFT_1998562 [Clavulina sp. PMI_390]|nr:hypothetical protein DL93DRAFT_1998562 [Clavulina sp. PMI_390]